MLKFPTTRENILHFLCLCYNRQITVILTENHYHWCHRFGVNINAVDYVTASLAPVWLKCRKERKELTMFLLWFWQMHFKPGFYAPYDLRILIWNLRHQLTEHLDVQHVNKEQKWSVPSVCARQELGGVRENKTHITHSCWCSPLMWYKGIQIFQPPGFWQDVLRHVIIGRVVILRENVLALLEKSLFFFLCSFLNGSYSTVCSSPIEFANMSNLVSLLQSEHFTLFTKSLPDVK